MARVWDKPPEAMLPRPEVGQRLATAEEANDCRSAKSLEALARKSGWETRLTYSKGPRIGADGKMLDIRESLMVAGHRRIEPNPGESFYAMWLKDLVPDKKTGKIGWSFDFAHYINGRVRARVNGNEIRDVVKS